MVPLVSDLSGFRSKQVDFDVNGKRLDPQMIEERGYTVDVGPEIVEVSIPYAAEGGTRKVSIGCFLKGIFIFAFSYIFFLIDFSLPCPDFCDGQHIP